jgi:hypothetical protein
MAFYVMDSGAQIMHLAEEIFTVGHKNGTFISCVTADMPINAIIF